MLIGAGRIGERGTAIGLDMTGEMLDLARPMLGRRASRTRWINGHIEDIRIEHPTSGLQNGASSGQTGARSAAAVTASAICTALAPSSPLA